MNGQNPPRMLSLELSRRAFLIRSYKLLYSTYVSDFLRCKSSSVRRLSKYEHFTRLQFRRQCSQKEWFSKYESIYATMLDEDVVLLPERIGTSIHDIPAEEAPHTWPRAVRAPSGRSSSPRIQIPLKRPQAHPHFRLYCIVSLSSALMTP